MCRSKNKTNMLIPTDYSFNSQSINRIHTIGAYLQDDTDIANKIQ